jgi:hypothetical protein
VSWRREGQEPHGGALHAELADRLFGLLGEPRSESKAQTKGTRDGRGIFAHITPGGRRLRKKMWPVYERAVKEHFLSKFGKEDIARIDKLMRRIRDESGP